MRLEKMNKEERKQFMDKFFFEELDTISKLLLDLNKDINIPNIAALIEDIQSIKKDSKQERTIDIKYILRKFDYSELLTLNDLFDIYSDDSKYERERYFVKAGIRNFQILANQTQDFESLGFDLAVYYWESLSPQVKRWYADSCDSEGKEVSPTEFYIYCKKINNEQIKYGRRLINENN